MPRFEFDPYDNKTLLTKPQEWKRSEPKKPLVQAGTGRGTGMTLAIAAKVESITSFDELLKDE